MGHNEYAFFILFVFLEPQEGVKMSLEGAQVAFISGDRLVISLKSGELYVLSLFADSMRSVRGFHFDKAAASVLTSCVSIYIKFLISIYARIFIILTIYMFLGLYV